MRYQPPSGSTVVRPDDVRRFIEDHTERRGRPVMLAADTVAVRDYAALGPDLRTGLRAALDIGEFGYGLLIDSDGRWYPPDGPQGDVVDLVIGIGTDLLGPLVAAKAMAKATSIGLGGAR